MEARLGQRAAVLPNFGGDDCPLMPESTGFPETFKHFFLDFSFFSFLATPSGNRLASQHQARDNPPFAHDFSRKPTPWLRAAIRS